MFSKRRLKLSIKLIITFCFIFLVLLIVPKALARYQSISSSNANVDIAFYVISSSMQTENLVMNDIEPSTEPYIYTFSVSNFQDTKRLETKAKYKIKITTTTNLPFVYELYQQNGTELVNVSLGESITPDSDGMYLRKIETNYYEFGYTSDETDIYQLYIYYPTGYDTYEYQNMVENISINIDSKQVLENDSVQF